MSIAKILMGIKPAAVVRNFRTSISIAKFLMGIKSV